VDIAVLEVVVVGYTEVAVAARPVMVNTVEQAEAVVDKAVLNTAVATEAAVVAILEVDLLFFEPPIWLARSSYQPSPSLLFVY